MTYHYDNKESGLVSIFSVIFFMILMSVLVVGFIKIMGDEVRQTTDNDLTASALISAQSGAEEAKRILLYCSSAGADAARCSAGLNQTGCKTAIQQFKSIPRLGLNVTANDEGIVTTDSSYEQRYTCMSITTQTPTVGPIEVATQKSQLIPLRSQSNFDRIKFAWHHTDTDKDGTPALGAAPLTSSQPEWNALNRPAMMRLEFIPYPKSGIIDLAAMEAATRTVFVTPSSSTTAVSIAIAARDQRAGDPNARTATDVVPASCDLVRTYVCEIELNLAGMPASATSNYMLRVSSYYRGGHIQMSLLDGTTPVNFDNVQPAIDVTGRTNDVFRRINTTVAYNSDYFMPEFALGSSEEICKMMSITADEGTSRNICNP